MRSLLLLAGSVLAATPALGQEVLLREGDPSPTGNPGEIVEFINAVAVSPNGAYGVVFQTDDGVDDVSRIWGSFSGGPPSVLRSEMTVGPLTQASFESSFGINGSQISYSALADEAGGSTSIDGIWIDDTPVILEEQPVPGSASQFWSFGSRAGITTSGEVTGFAGVTNSVGGSTQTRVMVVGSTIVHTSSLIDFDSWVSPDGSHTLAKIGLSGAHFLALDGSALILGGTVVGAGPPVPVSVGGRNGERWDNVDYLKINDSREYVFTGDADATDTAADEFVVRNGVMILREGDVIDGETLFAGVLGCSLNNNGDLALIWKALGDTEILIYNGEIILREGDMIDWDGDGTPEPTSILTDFTGTTRAIALTNDGVLYFTADVDVNGTVLEGFFRLDTRGAPIGSPFCAQALPNSTGVAGELSGLGSTAAADNAVTLVASNLPVGQFGIIVVAPQIGPGVVVPSGGILCLTNPAGRFNAPSQVLQANVNGVFSFPVDLTSIPTPTALVAVQPGDTLFFQAWHRDGTVGMPSSNFTTGLQIDFN